MNEHAWSPQETNTIQTMFETIVDYNDHNNTPLSNESLRQAIIKVMAEMEAK